MKNHGCHVCRQTRSLKRKMPLTMRRSQQDLSFKSLLLFLATCFFSFPPLASDSIEYTGLQEERVSGVKEILAQRIDQEKKGYGIVVGLIGSEGRSIVTHGRTEHGESSKLSGDSVFALASVTKVFVGLLLADMVHHNEVLLTDDVAAFIGNADLPEQDQKQPITLFNLATHTSGLPREPSNNVANYSEGDLHDFLTDYALVRKPETSFSYSNLGFGLLGYVLASHSKMTLGEALNRRVFTPIDMKSTGFVITPDMRGHVVRGHNREFEPAVPWDFGILEGAGGLWSSTNDLLNFLDAVLGNTDTALAPAIELQTASVLPTGSGDVQITLGWHIIPLPDGTRIIFHAGLTSGGYSTFLGYIPSERRGATVLSNAMFDVSDIGLHLLDGGIKLTPAGN